MTPCLSLFEHRIPNNKTVGNLAKESARVGSNWRWNLRNTFELIYSFGGTQPNALRSRVPEEKSAVQMSSLLRLFLLPKKGYPRLGMQNNKKNSVFFKVDGTVQEHRLLQASYRVGPRRRKVRLGIRPSQG